MIVILKYKTSGIFTQWELENPELYPLYTELVMVIGVSNESNHSKAVRIAAILNEK